MQSLSVRMELNMHVLQQKTEELESYVINVVLNSLIFLERFYIALLLYWFLPAFVSSVCINKCLVTAHFMWKMIYQTVN